MDLQQDEKNPLGLCGSSEVASIFHNGYFQRCGFYNKGICPQSSNYLPTMGNKTQIQWVAFGDVFLKCSQPLHEASIQTRHWSYSTEMFN